MTSSKNTGDKAETMAADFLYQQGFEILARNWRSGHHEIDIVAKHEGILHIIEVKCRKADGLTTPEDAMTPRKFSFLCKAANHYVTEHNIDLDVQFDLAAVEYDTQSQFTLRWFPNVMTPRW